MKTLRSILLGVAIGAVAGYVGTAAAANVVKRWQGTVVADRFNGTTLAIGGTDITATATELNYTDVTTAGTAQGSKALVLSSAKTLATVTQLTVGNYRTASSTASASGDLSTDALHAFQLWYVDTSGGAVDLDFGEDAVLAAADVGQSWRFEIVAGTNALTITAGTSVSTVATSNLLGAACEDVGDFFECVPYTTSAVKCWSYCAD